MPIGIVEIMDGAVRLVKGLPGATNLDSECDHNDGEIFFDLDQKPMVAKVRPNEIGWTILIVEDRD